METVLAEDIPKLMQRFPVEREQQSTNPFNDENDAFKDDDSAPTTTEVSMFL
jgi:hypothetical protein